jgi:hypothetical protein
MYDFLGVVGFGVAAVNGGRRIVEKTRKGDAMETIRLKAHVGTDGLLTIKLPAEMRNREFEVVIVMQPLASVETDALGYPPGYFEDTYGSFADSPLQRPVQGDVEI